MCTRVRKILAISRMGFVSARLGELDANKATIPRPSLLPNLHPPLREEIRKSRLETPNKGRRTEPHQSISSGIGAGEVGGARGQAARGCLCAGPQRERGRGRHYRSSPRPCQLTHNSRTCSHSLMCRSCCTRPTSPICSAAAGGAAPSAPLAKGTSRV